MNERMHAPNIRDKFIDKLIPADLVANPEPKISTGELIMSCAPMMTGLMEEALFSSRSTTISRETQQLLDEHGISY